MQMSPSGRKMIQNKQLSICTYKYAKHTMLWKFNSWWLTTIVWPWPQESERWVIYRKDINESHEATLQDCGVKEAHCIIIDCSNVNRMFKYLSMYEHGQLCGNIYYYTSCNYNIKSTTPVNSLLAYITPHRCIHTSTHAHACIHGPWQSYLKRTLLSWLINRSLFWGTGLYLFTLYKVGNIYSSAWFASRFFH